MANNHAMDYGAVALLDTLDLLDAAGIAHVGAGANEVAARKPVVVEVAGVRVGVVGIADHPVDFAAGANEPGIAYDNLRQGSPDWLTQTIADVDADIVLVTPHWGPNMTTEPLPRVRRAAAAFREAGAGLVAGHSAHVFHGVADAVLFDLGDFIDDYAVDPKLRNNLTLLFLVSFDGSRPTGLEAVPLAIEHCHTRLADARETAWIRRRFRNACRALGTEVGERAGRLVVEWD
jgi:poly-gamma-glutamate synthesis protein (capsule biosynthesis protein)